MIVLDEIKFDEPKTKEMIKMLANVKAGKKALIVMAEKDENVIKSAANIPGSKNCSSRNNERLRDYQSHKLHRY